jgi:sporulation protein YlmC with PRC-barrel domain
MTASTSLRLERLLGRRVIDALGYEVGCIEDVVAEPVGDDYLVTHVVITGANPLARLLGLLHQVPTLRAMGLGRRPRIRRIPWTWLDLSDPDRPRLLPTVADQSGSS